MRLTLLTLLALLLTLTPKVHAMTIAPKNTPNPPQSRVEKMVETSMIILSCPTNIKNAAAMCTALKSALQERAPRHNIQLGNHTPGPDDLAVKLHITRADKTTIEGYLEWQTKSAAAQSGPPVTFGVVDTTITAQMYSSFASGLIKVSKLPIP